jgi:hypothetical protein
VKISGEKEEWRKEEGKKREKVKCFTEWRKKKRKMRNLKIHEPILAISVADPDPGSGIGCFLTP